MSGQALHKHEAAALFRHSARTGFSPGSMPGPARTPPHDTSEAIRMKTILFLCAALLLPACGEDLSTEGGLKTARFGNFVFEYPKEEETTVRSLGKHCPVIEERIAEDLGPVSMGTVRVLIAADEQAFLDAWPGTGTPRRWAAAVANPEAGVIVMKSPRMLLGSRDTYETIFLHEVTHIALHRAISLPPGTGGGPGTPEPDALFARGPKSPEIPT